MSGLGRWASFGVAATVRLLRDAPFRWWITGGYALDLHLGQQWRPHADTDIGMDRHDCPSPRRWLAGWDLHVAADGVLSGWDGRNLRPPTAY